MSHKRPPAVVCPAAVVTTVCSTLLLLSTCSQQCEGFAPPLKNCNSNSNNRQLLSASASRTALAGGNIACNSPRLLSRGQRQQQQEQQQQGALFPRLSAAAGDGDAATTAPTAPADFQDPLLGAPDDVAAEGSKAAVPKKRKAAPRKKMTPEEAAAKRKAAALKRKQIRDNMTPEEKAAQKEAAALKRKEKLANMTPEEKAAKKAAAELRRAMKPKPTPEEAAAKKEAMALRRTEKKEREQREWEEQEAKKRFERLAGASLTIEDLEAGGGAAGGGAGSVKISDSAPSGKRMSVGDSDEEEFEGWEFVEEGEEDDETEEVPYWEGEAPTYDEDGSIQGLEKGGLRVANAALTTKDDTIGVKVQTDEEFHWYLLRCFATYEVRCRNSVETYLEGAGLGDRVEEIWVPCRQVPKQVGKKVTFKEEPIYQGYIYCKVKMSLEVRDIVNDMDRIVGFVGEARDEDKKLIPERMDPEDIEGIKASEKALGANKIPQLLGVGDLVEISEGPFSLKKGEVSKIKDGEYVVKVNTFGRNSDVRLDWDGVRKLTELEVETWFEETRRAMDATYMERESGRGGRGRRRRGGGGFVYDSDNGYEPGRGRGRGRGGRGREEMAAAEGRGLRGFDEDDEQAADRRRFMEKDLAMWEAEVAKPETRVRRPTGDRVDAELPEEAFESNRDADDFFDSLDSILGEDGRKGPALPGARTQGPSVVERAHAVAEHKKRLDADGFDFSSPDFQDPNGSKIRPRGSTGSAGLLEPGVSRVTRDAPPAAGLSSIGTAAGGSDGEDDDLFASLMKELKESPPASAATGRQAGEDDLASSSLSDAPSRRGPVDENLEDLLAGSPLPPPTVSRGAAGRWQQQQQPSLKSIAAALDDKELEDLLTGLESSSPPPTVSRGAAGRWQQQQQPSLKSTAAALGDKEFEGLLTGLESSSPPPAATARRSSSPRGTGGPADRNGDLGDDPLSAWGEGGGVGVGGGGGAAGSSPVAAGPGRGAAGAAAPPRAGGVDGDFEELLAGLERGEGLDAAAAAASASSSLPDVEESFDEIDDLFSGLGQMGANTNTKADGPSKSPPRPINGRGGEAMAKGVQAGEAIINELLKSGISAGGVDGSRVSSAAPTNPRQTSPQNGPRNGPRIISPQEREQFRRKQQQQRQASPPQRTAPQTVSRTSPPPPLRAVPPRPAAVNPANTARGAAAGADSGSDTAKPFFSDFDLLPPVPGERSRVEEGQHMGGSGGRRQERQPGPATQNAGSLGNQELSENRSAERRPPAKERLPAVAQAPAPAPAAAAEFAPKDDFGDLDAILGEPLAGDGAASLGGAVGSPASPAAPSSGSSEVEEDGDGGDGASGVVGGGGAGSGGDAAKAEVESMKVPELKARCKALGLKVGGRKAELQARILEAL